VSTFEIRNQNEYAAEVVRVTTLTPLAGLDNLVGLPVNGYTALVPRASTAVGDLLVVFPAEAQLSPAFASANNLYRHSDRNADESVQGYLEDNARVRAIRLRGHTSSALALPISSLWPMLAGNDLDLDDRVKEQYPPVGTQFDHINGVQISQKYVINVPGDPTAKKDAQKKVWRRVEDKYLPEHIDSANYWRNAEKIDPDTIVTVSQKLHGTSWRGARTIVKRELTWLERLAKRFGMRIAETEYDVVFGSRKVIKDPNNPRQDHFYGSDIWTDFGQTVADLIPENVVVYGELIGWVGDAPIQKGYTYNVPRGAVELYIYRVAVVSNDGHLYDLSWEGMEQFAAERGWKVVPLLWRGPHREFVAEDWLDTVYSKQYAQALPLSDKGTVDEGVVVRAEGILPVALKAKSPRFFEWESKILDEGVEVLS
jgi:hypothetical protein